jgi:putative spermidine/putrescine transport system permease protein
LILLIILLPQAFPSVAVYLNIARLFYMIGLNGTITGVVLVHAVHGLVIVVWIAAAAFAAVDVELELRIDHFAQMRLEAFVRALLIRAHQARIAHHIRGEDRGETAGGGHGGHCSAAITSAPNLT